MFPQNIHDQLEYGMAVPVTLSDMFGYEISYICESGIENKSANFWVRALQSSGRIAITFSNLYLIARWRLSWLQRI